jgi:hypothetical protein
LRFDLGTASEGNETDAYTLDTSTVGAEPLNVGK